MKLKKSDMSMLTRSATLPYATTDAATLTAMARRLLLDPVEVGPIRLVGVGFSGLTDVRQESLFPDLELAAEEDVSHTRLPPTLTDATATAPAWRIGDDVVHTQHGHGWLQGAGHGVMTVRFETRSTGPGPVHTFPDDNPDIARANPVDSLDWPAFVSELAARATRGTRRPLRSENRARRTSCTSRCPDGRRRSLRPSSRADSPREARRHRG